MVEEVGRFYVKNTRMIHGPRLFWNCVVNFYGL